MRSRSRSRAAVGSARASGSSGRRTSSARPRSLAAQTVSMIRSTSIGNARAACRTSWPTSVPARRGWRPASSCNRRTSGKSARRRMKRWASRGISQRSSCSICSATDSGGSAARAASIAASSIGIGAESVSGYIRSGPGSTRSNTVVPSDAALRVSFGTPSNASRQRSSTVSIAVWISG